MMEKEDEIEPKVIKDKYLLEDNEYLLIKSLRNLQKSIEMLSRKLE